QRRSHADSMARHLTPQPGQSGKAAVSCRRSEFVDDANVLKSLDSSGVNNPRGFAGGGSRSDSGLVLGFCRK
ncbi:MAG TPA: hypothetical protein VJ124_11945, partial [Pyrinomonadaceae bacterium]|nr:hypothetical protein [Pyrinomonadaceae bacterium]